MFRIIITGILLGPVLALMGQNILDEQGRKTGHWKVEYSNGKTRYEGDFSEGRPIGELVRYYESGAIRARMSFDPEQQRSFARLFYKNGKLAAEGIYRNQLKDSVWTYFSELDGTIRIRESYASGKLHGMVRHYYPSGVVSEEVEWNQDVMDGTWKQYYNNTQPRLSGIYKKGKLEGLYEIYYEDGTIKIRGNYLENRSDGTWYFFNEEGKEIYALEYINGAPANREKYELWIQDTLKKYENISKPGSFEQF